MKQLLTVLIVILASSLGVEAQTFKINTAAPAFEILEWKGFGAILLNRDPSGNSQQITMTLIGNKTTSIWDQKFIPRGEEFYYIAADNQRYVYFLDNLELENGKVYFSQLSSAGNIKTTNVSLTSVIKKLGDYDPLDLKLKTVIVTDLALVHVFEHRNKKEKQVSEIATFITHHNMREYATVLGTTTEENLKSGLSGNWKYGGFTGDKILFYASEKKGKDAGYTLKEFSSKGELINSRYIKSPENTFDLLPVTTFGTNGGYYLEAEFGADRGIVNFLDNRLYFTGITTKSEQKNIEVYEWMTDKWKLLNTIPVSSSLSKKISGVGTYVLLEGIATLVKSGNSGEVYFSSTDEKQVNNTLSYSKSINFNPSRMILSGKEKLFAVTLPDAELYFDLQQLNKESSVEFELIQK